MAYPMGKANLEPARLDSGRHLKRLLHGRRIAADASPLGCRRPPDALRLTERAGSILAAASRGANVQPLLGGLSRLSVFARRDDDRDVTAAQPLFFDPAIGQSPPQAIG